MAGSRRSPHADDPNCGGAGANSSMKPQDVGYIEAYSPAAFPPSAHPSRQPGRPILVNEEPSDGSTIGAASSSACGPDGDEDAKITDKSAPTFLLGPRVLSSPMVASGFDSDDESWVGFSDRTGDGASTSMSSPDAYDYRTFFGDPPSYGQILEHSFWRHDYEACDDFSMVLRTSRNGSRTVYEKEPLSSLQSEFVYKAMKDKSNMLLANYSAYRKVLGDGNCFYRSFIYSYLEQLAVSPGEGEELRLLSALELMLDKFERLNWPDSYSDGYNAFMGLILECMDQKQRLSVSDYEDWLFQESQNEQKFTDILSYLRLLTAIEICTEPERFAPHITGLDPVNPDVVGYCRQEVIPMDKEAEQEAPFALTDVLRVPLRIVYIAMSGNVEPNTHIIYESPHLPLVPCVTLLYRPGHYDILYR
ncbi:unnamed protein product [Alopecurus aequalis]